MIAWAYYNEHDAETAAWLKNNIKAGLIAPGIVDTRSITEVSPDDLGGFTQCHFFAGIGGWSYAARLAGWPDDWPMWTGSCPCQPFSAAGKRAGIDDPRHLWPDFHRLIRARRPAVVMGEQVAGAAGYGWFDGVRADLEGEGYAGRCVDVPALAVDAPHQRNRLYWLAVGDANGPGQQGKPIAERIAAPSSWRPDAERTDGGDGGPGSCPGAVGEPAGLGRPENQARQQPACRPVEPDEEGVMAHTGSGGLRDARCAEAAGPTRQVSGEIREQWFRADDGAAHDRRRNGSWWAGADWILCHDGKARRVADASAPLLVDGFPNRVLAWRGLGNAIVPPLAAEVIAALMDVME